MLPLLQFAAPFLRTLMRSLVVVMVVATTTDSIPADGNLRLLFLVGLKILFLVFLLLNKY